MCAEIPFYEGVLKAIELLEGKMDPMTAMTVRVKNVEIDPEGHDLSRRWLVTAEVLDGEPPTELTLLVHSPILAFGHPEPAGLRFRLELHEPVTRPYTGRFTARAIRGG